MFHPENSYNLEVKEEIDGDVRKKSGWCYTMSGGIVPT